MAKPSKTKSIERLKRARIEIPKLKDLPSFSPEFKRWHRNTAIAIEHTFGKEGRHVDDFTKVRYSLPVYTSSTPKSRFQEAFGEGLESADTVLVV